ncbi:MAG: hypothetical protein M3416_21555 [Acidobacteriota bacterium]|nr:hypothetical protein [Acidobacteriota bacterium]
MRRTFARMLMLLAASAALVFQGTAAAPQASTITDNMTVPIDFIATSCTGETIIISGESHVVVHATGTPSGHGTFKTHIQFHLSGESPSGTLYNANETVESVETGGDGTAFAFNSVGNLNLVSAGSEDNLIVRTRIHTTVNANGEITSTNFEFTVECQG